MKELLEHNIVGKSEAIKKVIKIIKVNSKFPTPVLITGETGTGKELAARGVHYSGVLAARPFIAVNCSTFTDDLFVSELFGYKKGAFTDAKKDTPGLLIAAKGGSLFLDEIDSLSLKSQAALLRFLQEKEYRPIGSNVTCSADVRLIAATNRSLPELIAKGEFREDLYYRLLILTIHMPPLRERLDDIEELVNCFVHKLNQQYGMEREGVSQGVLRRLSQHAWPGNVRELENTIHRLYLTSERELIDELDSCQFVCDSTDSPNAFNDSATCNQKFFESANMTFADEKRKAVEAFEQSFVKQLLTYTNGNITQAANLCGKERRAFGKLVKKYNISKYQSSQYNEPL